MALKEMRMTEEPPASAGSIHTELADVLNPHHGLSRFQKKSTNNSPTILTPICLSHHLVQWDI